MSHSDLRLAICSGLSFRILDKYGILWCYQFNPFFLKFLKWTFPSLNLDASTVANRNVSTNTEQNGKQWILSDEMSHLDLHCLHK